MNLNNIYFRINFFLADLTYNLYKRLDIRVCGRRISNF